MESASISFSHIGACSLASFLCQFCSFMQMEVCLFPGMCVHTQHRTPLCMCAVCSFAYLTHVCLLCAACERQPLLPARMCILSVHCAQRFQTSGFCRGQCTTHNCWTIMMWFFFLGGCACKHTFESILNLFSPLQTFLPLSKDAVP